MASSLEAPSKTMQALLQKVAAMQIAWARSHIPPNLAVIVSYDTFSPTKLKGMSEEERIRFAQHLFDTVCKMLNRHA